MLLMALYHQHYYTLVAEIAVVVGKVQIFLVALLIADYGYVVVYRFADLMKMRSYHSSWQPSTLASSRFLK